MQIRNRLTLLFTLNAAAILASVLLYVWLSYKHQNEADFFENLESQAAFTIHTTIPIAQNLSALPISWVGSTADTLPYRENVSIYNDAYERIFNSNPEAPPISIKVLQDIQVEKSLRFRNRNLFALGKAINQKNHGTFLVITEGYCDPSGAEKLGRILIYSFVLGLAALTALGWLLAGIALRPVSDLMDQVNAMHPEDLSKRVETGTGKDELTRLGQTFNSLLDRVENAFRMQRMFLSNVSHELRNPLTAIRTQLDVTLQRERSPETYRNALESVLDDMKEVSEIEEKLLLLAKVLNNPNAIKLESLRLDELVWQSRELIQRRNKAYKVNIEYDQLPETEDQLLIAGNEALLRSAMLNLVENACKYSPDHKAILRMICTQNDGLIVEVIDHGPGISKEEATLIFQAFYRSPGQSGKKGAGVGLSLVKSILDHHHIRLELDNAATKGSIFRLFFPKHTP